MKRNQAKHDAIECLLRKVAQAQMSQRPFSVSCDDRNYSSGLWLASKKVSINEAKNVAGFMSWFIFGKTSQWSRALILQSGPDLIKFFGRCVTLLQNFKPMNDDKIGHMTILLLSDWFKILV